VFQPVLPSKRSAKSRRAINSDGNSRPHKGRVIYRTVRACGGDMVGRRGSKSPSASCTLRTVLPAPVVERETNDSQSRNRPGHTLFPSSLLAPAPSLQLNLQRTEARSSGKSLHVVLNLHRKGKKRAKTATRSNERRALAAPYSCCTAAGRCMACSDARDDAEGILFWIPF